MIPLITWLGRINRPSHFFGQGSAKKNTSPILCRLGFFWSQLTATPVLRCAKGNAVLRIFGLGTAGTPGKLLPRIPSSSPCTVGSLTLSCGALGTPSGSFVEKPGGGIHRLMGRLQIVINLKSKRLYSFKTFWMFNLRNLYSQQYVEIKLERDYHTNQNISHLS